MAIIARYKFNPSLCADYLPVFNSEFTGYTKTDVNNGDGTITRTISHDTLKPTYMKFGGTFGNPTDREKSLIEVMECDTSEVTNMGNMFQSCHSLISLNVSSFNTSKATNMGYMFNDCKLLTSLDLSNFDTSKVTNFDSIFENCTSLATINVSSWDTSKVTNIAYMFNGCNKLTSLDVSNFNTSNVTVMNKMFSNCSKLTSLDISNFDTSNVTNMDWMFAYCSKLTTLDLSNFNTSNVTNMDFMLSNCTVSDIGLLYATSSTINSLLTQLGTSIARNIYYTDAPLSELTVQDNITYKKYEMTQATFPYTLNKLPNGVADYIDVVNKVHVQRVGVALYNGDGMLSYGTTGNDDYRFTTAPILDVNNKLWWGTGTDFLYAHSSVRDVRGYDNCLVLYPVDKNITLADFQAILQANPITVLYPLSTPIYTPLTEEQIAQLPLSAYADGCINLSSDQLMPSFEFRMRASNRYQVDMLETGYYYLNAPVGNVKLGTANVDVQQMPCIVKVDNVGTGDSGYRLAFSGNIMYTDVTSTFGGFISSINGTIDANGEGDSYTDFIKVKPNSTVSATSYIESPIGNGYGVIIGEYDSNKNFIKINTTEERTITTTTTDNTYYIRVSYRCGSSDNIKKIKVGLPPFITLAKLPSHRIPTTFTQGMKCGTDFGYWEGIKESAWRGIRLTGESGDGSLRSADNNIRYLNRLEGNYLGQVIVEDEFDFGTGKLIKRVGKVVLDGSIFIYDFKAMGKEHTYMTISGDRMGITFKNSFGGNKYGLAMSNTIPFTVNYAGEFNHMFVGGNNLIIIMKTNELGTPTKEGIAKYFESNPMTVYYQLAVPEISYVDVLSHYGKTASNKTDLKTNYYIANTYLQPQIKPSHLTYPVPSLVANREYTVVHNRKNITGSTKPIELNLGGTVVQLNDASSKTLVKTPSTLAHNNLIFIGGESTVDHIMVLDGDWTNKPIEYFENMKGHDTDAIITIIGDGKIDDVAEQYLW